MVKAELTEVENLIDQGKFDEALSFVDTFDDLQMKLWKRGVIYERMGKFEEAERVAQELETITTDPVFELRALITLSYTCWRLDKPDEWKIKIDRGRSIIASHPDIEDKHLFLGELTYLNGIRHHMVSEYWDALDNFEQSLQYRKELGEPGPISHSLNALGIVNELLGKLNPALEYYHRSLKLKREKGNIQDIYRSLVNLGILHSRLGEFSEATKKFEEGVALAEKIGLDEEVTKFKRSMADLARKRNRYDESIALLEEVKDLEKSSNNDLSLITYVSLIMLYSDMEEFAKASDFIDMMRETADNPSFHTKVQMDLAESYYLLSHPRPLNKMRAQDTLRGLLDNLDRVPSEEQIQILVYLARSLVYELNQYAEPEILSELNQITSQLEDIAKHNHLIMEQIEVLELKSKIEVIQDNLELARSILADAIELAKENEFTKRANRLTEQFDLIQLQGNIAQSTAELIDNLDLDQILSRLVAEEGIAAPIIEQEQPLMILFLNEGGSAIYEYYLEKSEIIQHESLMASFISAILSFGDEIFAAGDARFNRIEHRGFSILSSRYKSLTFTYIFKGSNYPATKRFDTMTSKLVELPFLVNYSNNHQKVNGNDKKVLDDIIENIFRNVTDKPLQF